MTFAAFALAFVVVAASPSASEIDVNPQAENKTTNAEAQFYRERSRPTRFVLFMTSAPVQLAIWFGFYTWLLMAGVLKRPRQSTSPARAQRLRTSSGSSLPPKIQNKRYAMDFWGKAWSGTAGGRGIKKEFPTESSRSDSIEARMAAGVEVDLEQCRALLKTLEPEDLRTRLSNSRWQATKQESWLCEAASAFSIGVKAQSKWRKKTEVIEEMMAAVQMSKEASEDQRPQGAAAPKPPEVTGDASAASAGAVPAKRLRTKTPPPQPLAGSKQASGSAQRSSITDRSAEVTLEAQQYRYDPQHWGRHGHNKGGRGNKTKGKTENENVDASASVEAAATWDLPLCRSLLLTLDADDTKQRLCDSPWHQVILPTLFFTQLLEVSLAMLS